jgi:hypothetical protein
MNKELQQTLGLWLSTKQSEAWVRGKNDCATFFLEWHDKRFGTDERSLVYNKYNDIKSAIRFAKKFFPLEKWQGWFTDHGYTQVEAPQTGDIVMVEGRYFPSSYIICMNTAWSISDNAQRMTRHELDVPMGNYSIWRHTNGS